MRKRIIQFPTPAYFLSYAAVGGYEEGKGPLKEALDMRHQKDDFGMNTWEKAEGEMGRQALALTMKKARMSPKGVSVLFAGDLQNQCVASSGGLYTYGIPYIGLYGACSTCTESLLCASLYLSNREEPDTVCAAVTTSHNCAAERQFRLPIEYGGQRTPTAQWTATAAGAFLLTKRPTKVRITAGMPGKIVDGEICDPANMGGAMARAAADTLLHYFGESQTSPDDYDAVVTGDLGEVGSEILCELTAEEGVPLAEKHKDCGCMLYNKQKQDVHSGASGCGCSAAVLASYFLPALSDGRLNRILFLSTGALMSAGSVQQKEPILGIAPLLLIENGGNEG